MTETRQARTRPLVAEAVVTERLRALGYLD